MSRAKRVAEDYYRGFVVAGSGPHREPHDAALLPAWRGPASASATESLRFADLRNRYDRVVIWLPRGDIDLLGR
jgi:hypothetical protein